ncbi:hypothetical protein AGR7A_Cc10056 [Agrobacterium deltaense NCPPB 1641]|uniref:Recombinase domain-containing protein n=1 Tax=Agrobacterium deltaense NCPPB 1641 TaxID=1183425 RepID=A0A1S7TIC5_9HYPH|nr:hypothetical protein AGR7A_Cc10056 [Agrobacterium deltaense NCPPB 1641]
MLVFTRHRPAFEQGGRPGSRGRKWRDIAIRGHVSRGTGILNNESYIGRMVWNKRNYRKNPETERRTTRVNDASEWVLIDVPEMRIVSDDLWQRVKECQRRSVSFAISGRVTG